MRRIVVVATALAVLIAAASAFAATGGINTYTASLKFSPNKAGSGKAPSSMGFTQKYVANGTNGNRTAPLTDIKTTIYGLTSDGKDFPTCSSSKIVSAGNDTVCPKGALVASGAITAILGPLTEPELERAGQLPCNPLLDVWNAGQGKVVYFFVDKGAGSHLAAPIHDRRRPAVPRNDQDRRQEPRDEHPDPELRLVPDPRGSRARSRVRR